MAERVKLTDPGHEFTMAVAKVNTETIEGVEYKSFTDGTNEIIVPASTVKSQLIRLTVDTAEGLAGKTVKFGRSHKLSRYGKPYWDIDLAPNAQPSASNGKPPVSQVSPDTTEKPKMREAYKSLTQWVVDEITPIYDAEFGNGEFTPADAAACVQTLFIQACKAGKVE